MQFSHYLCNQNQKKMKRSILALLTVLVLYSCSEQKERVVKAPIRVKSEVVASGSADGNQTYVGIVEANEGTAVSFTNMGVVKRVLVSEGQSVSRGQLLAVMDDTQARNILLGADGSLPEVQWVEILSKVEQAKAQLAIAKKNVADCRLLSPVSGIVGRRMLSAGETTSPSQAVVTIVDVNSVKVKVSVPESEIGSIQGDTRSAIRVDAIDRTYEGGRIEKGVLADAMTHTYDIRIQVANHDRRLLPGMVASVQLANRSAGMVKCLTVPITSIQRRGDGSLFIWTIDDSQLAHRTPVTIGSTEGNRVVVIDGLEDGQRIVTEGYQKLSEGSHVVY